MGQVVGGWSYVWASYAVTWIVVLVYGVNLYARRRAKSP